MGYRIKSVAAMTGLTTSTLRAWERRYGLVAPERTRGGYRVYTEDDVARLTRIKSLLDNGFKVSEAIALVEREALPLPHSDASTESLQAIRSELLEALLEMDRPTASRVADRLAALTFERRIDEILFPVLREIGVRWVNGEANIAQEHFASAFVREKLIGMLEELDSGPAHGEEVFCFGVPGEMHEIGLLATAVHLALRGWRVTYLGIDLPFADLREAVRQRPPALLCTALVQYPPSVKLDEVATALRDLAPEDTDIVIGGPGAMRNGGPSLPRRVHLAPDLHELLTSSYVEVTR